MVPNEPKKVIKLADGMLDATKLTEEIKARRLPALVSTLMYIRQKLLQMYSFSRAVF
jgi:hypothetical protein